MKHTPGPWAFCNDTLCQANGRYLHLGKWIESSGLGNAAEPNKRLIAAAPDLLAALHGMVALFDQGTNVAGTAERFARYEAAIAAASAAIVKATNPEN